MTNRSHTWWVQALPLLAVLGSVTALGLGTSLAKSLFPLVGSLGTSALRVGFSALLLLLIWRPWRWTLRPGDGRALLRYGVALGCMNLLFYQSLQTLPFGIAVAIEFSGPLAVALFYSRRWIDFVWFGLAVGGLALLLPIGSNGQDMASALDPMGVTYALGAAACWAAYIVFGKRLGHLHAGHSVALGLSVAAITVVPFGVWHAGAELLQPSILLTGVVVAAISRHSDFFGNGGAQASAASRLWHHDQPGACGGGAVGAAIAGRAAHHPAVAGDWLHHAGSCRVCSHGTAANTSPPGCGDLIS